MIGMYLITALNQGRSASDGLGLAMSNELTRTTRCFVFLSQSFVSLLVKSLKLYSDQNHSTVHTSGCSFFAGFQVEKLIHLKGV